MKTFVCHGWRTFLETLWSSSKQSSVFERQMSKTCRQKIQSRVMPLCRCCPFSVVVFRAQITSIQKQCGIFRRFRMERRTYGLYRLRWNFFTLSFVNKFARTSLERFERLISLLQFLSFPSHFELPDFSCRYLGRSRNAPPCCVTTNTTAMSTATFLLSRWFDTEL